MKIQKRFLTVRHKYIKKDAHDDGSVICDIVVIVGISLLVPFLKSASVHQTVAVFRREYNSIKSLKSW